MASNNTSVSSNMCFMSYNTTGWSVFKAQFILNFLLTQCVHICAIQEHFLLKENVFKIKEVLKDYEVFALPAFKSDLAVTAGRPSGGLALIYHRSLGHLVTRVAPPSSNRVDGITVDTPGSKFLIINVYLPNDNRNNDTYDLVISLQDITFLLEEYGVGRIAIVMGDLNCDFSRNTNFVRTVQTFIDQNNFATMWSRFHCDYTYSHTREVNNRLSTSFSTIDHFLVPTEEINNCVHAAVSHSSSLSNHDPIFFKMSYKLSTPQEAGLEDRKKSSPCWKKANPNAIQSFQNDLDNKLSHINIPDAAIYCRDVTCSSAHHKQQIDDVSDAVMEALSECVVKNIPHTKPSGKSHAIPGWTTFVEPYKMDADFWGSVWVSAGRPQNTELHRLAKYTKHKYHWSINRVKKFEQEIRKSKFLSECLDGKVNNILQDMKKLRGNNSHTPGSIDGLSNPKDIANHFKDLYQEIFNVHNDSDEVKVILDEINANMKPSDIEVVDKIDSDLIRKVVKNLLSDKNDPIFNFKSDAFKKGIDSLCDPLCDLIKSFIVHGHIPDIFLVCSLIPIIKDKRASSLSSDNYRLIAITSLILKLFDGVLLELYGDNLKPSALQFGFQRGQSTTMATWTLKETISYFRSHGSPIYLCLLDLTKAFDHVKFSTLFTLLKERIPPILLRFVICSYTHQQCNVVWQNSSSSTFTISNGVRQGSIASPTYFNIYIDSIFKELKDSNLGCWIGDIFYGALGYADDLALLAPSRGTLQKMVGKCETFFNSIGIKVSTNPVPKKSKTLCIAFGVKCVPEPLVLYGNALPFVKQHKHLGHLVHEDESSTHDMQARLRELVAKFHSLRQQVGRQDPIVMMTLVRTYLCSLYGSSLWDLSGTESIQADTTWNSIVRSAFELPMDTHRYIVEHLTNGKHIRHIILKRFQNFHAQLKACNKEEVHQLVRLQECDDRSVFGRNCRYIKERLGVQRIEDAHIDSIPSYPIPEDSAWKTIVITDLIDLKRGLLHIGEFTAQEASRLLNNLCSN